ncbi:hypothetical protein HELRODRAFT_162788 [Helobdella robusta]|uniref:Endonuclease/exonuclease/phosphatase domain-containing protein n=1 Tax=Helobdella robusta TaxID=6412 RepID=T1ET55_HELRO|nr:hypothetical protein HELRODRAFT_162788 [Helobdella robusta]ESN99270.1 hypothetical protein HELRODRAFT_162788 [Helobdella robusta]
MIIGDLNVYFKDSSKNYTISFFNLISSFGFEHLPTSTHNKGGLLDVIISNPSVGFYDVRVHPPLISDHGLVTCSLNVKINYKKLNNDLIANNLCDSDVYLRYGVVGLFNLCDSTLCGLFDQHAPLSVEKTTNEKESLVQFRMSGEKT